MSDRETSREIDAAAADWVARIDNGPLSQQERATLDDWIAGDVRRLGAYAKAKAVFAHGRRAKALGTVFGSARPAHPSRRRVLWASASALAASLLAAAGFRIWMGPGQYQTSRGEIRLVPLSDGSSVTLNTISEVAVRFSESERNVQLISGEALFDVAKDPSRPFVVEAGDTVVTAVGTSFTVQRFSDRPVQVLVQEGIVTVKRRALQEAAPVRVVANTRVEAKGDIGVQMASVEPREVARALAWRQGKLSFEDKRLDEAAAEFARYSDTHIIVDDPAIASQTITGAFSADNPIGFAHAAASALGLHAEIAHGQIRIAR